jgi:hypothetical protein
MGFVIMHGPHHAAQKSMTTGLLDPEVFCWNSTLFMANNFGADDFSSAQVLIGYLFVCAKFERRIQRAEGYHCREQEDSSEYCEHDAKCSSDNPAKI